MLLNFRPQRQGPGLIQGEQELVVVLDKLTRRGPGVGRDQEGNVAIGIAVRGLRQPTNGQRPTVKMVN
jgi:hypothetical protein